MSPQQVDAMSLYQFACCVDGYNAANSPDEPDGSPSAEEFEAAKRLHGDL